MASVYHAKYFANELTRRSATDGVAKLSISLFDAAVDLNPHQIEAGLILCQYWAERRRKLLVICPASLRKQWSLELQAKTCHTPCGQVTFCITGHPVRISFVEDLRKAFSLRSDCRPRRTDNRTGATHDAEDLPRNPVHDSLECKVTTLETTV